MFGTLKYLVDEAGLAHIGEAADDDGASERIDGWQPGQMLAHLFQVLQVGTLPFHNGGHSTGKRKCESSSLTKTNINKGKLAFCSIN